MSKMIYCLFLLTIGLLITQSLTLPTPDEERYWDKEYNRELLNWLSSVQYPQQFINPCKYYMGNMLTGPVPKRNSELINSLLSLPKNMNDAGK
ncbi:protein PDF isoform X2 [Teleopsis dalmanni]|uniref:protein PDF isoform X2 n=1 Tax=Teleopsis dalmanni TaxID=139649 RepID=UPI0018CE633B|nr:protein PDF isoform X2 [Teleopsis dalmanni]